MTGSEEPGCLARPTRRSTGPLVFLMPQSPSDSACPRYFTVNVSGSSSCARNPPSCVFELLPDISPQHRLVKASTCDKEQSFVLRDILRLLELLILQESLSLRVASDISNSELHLPQREIINTVSLLTSLLELFMVQESTALRLRVVSRHIQLISRQTAIIHPKSPLKSPYSTYHKEKSLIL